MARFVFGAFALLLSASGWAQNPTLNNLIHPAGYRTAPWGELGDVKKSGSGKQDVILLPGWGFDQTIFNDFAARHEKDFRMFAVTFPGFGSTHAPPMPAQPESYGNTYWTKGILQALVELIKLEKLSNPVIVSCFTYSNQIAMRLALDHPDLVSKVIIVGGMGKFTMNFPSYEPRTLEQRVTYIDRVLSEMWFKTVTKETWDKGNFVPRTFCMDSVKAKQHWAMMSSVPIPIMVRYLCESYSMDLSLEYKNLIVPALVVVPAFTPDFLSAPLHSYVAPFFHASWLGALPASRQIQMVTLSDTHAFIMDDQPEKLDLLIKEFLDGSFKASPPVR